MIINPKIGITTDLEQLASFAPPWIGISRESGPHPEDERLTLFRYTITDHAADQSYVFQHVCHNVLMGVIAGTVAAIGEFGTSIVQIPHNLTIELERLQSECCEEPTCRVKLMDPANNRCLHHFEAEEILEAFRGFWENLDPSTVAQATTGPEPAMS